MKPQSYGRSDPTTQSVDGLTPVPVFFLTSAGPLQQSRAKPSNSRSPVFTFTAALFSWMHLTNTRSGVPVDLYRCQGSGGAPGGSDHRGLREPVTLCHVRTFFTRTILSGSPMDISKYCNSNGLQPGQAMASNVRRVH